MIRRFRNGIKCISTRTIGYDHRCGIRRVAGNRRNQCDLFSDSVADYTVMMILMGLRKIKHIMQRGRRISLCGESWPESFRLYCGHHRDRPYLGDRDTRSERFPGCRMIAYDLYEKDSVKKYAQYVDLIRFCGKRYHYAACAGHSRKLSHDRRQSHGKDKRGRRYRQLRQGL